MLTKRTWFRLSFSPKGDSFTEEPIPTTKGPKEKLDRRTSRKSMHVESKPLVETKPAAPAPAPATAHPASGSGELKPEEGALEYR